MLYNCGLAIGTRMSDIYDAVIIIDILTGCLEVIEPTSDMAFGYVRVDIIGDCLCVKPTHQDWLERSR